MSRQPDALQIADDLEYSAHYSLVHTAAAELRRLHQHEIANNEWWGKTDWVQETCKSHELGMHRADVLKQRIDRLHQVNQELVEALQEVLDKIPLSDSSYFETPTASKARAALAKHKEASMNDRELLELAAKAAEYSLLTEGESKDCYIAWNGREPNSWNPLTDDGDALRLAVTLNLGISVPTHKTTLVDVICFKNSAVNIRVLGGCPYSATRRAIVRAAAEIGKHKEQE